MGLKDQHSCQFCLYLSEQEWQIHNSRPIPQIMQWNHQASANTAGSFLMLHEEAHSYIPVGASGRVW